MRFDGPAVGARDCNPGRGRDVRAAGRGARFFTHAHARVCADSSGIRRDCGERAAVDSANLDTRGVALARRFRDGDFVALAARDVRDWEPGDLCSCGFCDCGWEVSSPTSPLLLSHPGKVYDESRI